LCVIGFLLSLVSALASVRIRAACIPRHWLPAATAHCRSRWTKEFAVLHFLLCAAQKLQTQPVHFRNLLTSHVICSVCCCVQICVGSSRVDSPHSVCSRLRTALEL